MHWKGYYISKTAQQSILALPTSLSIFVKVFLITKSYKKNQHLPTFEQVNTFGPLLLWDELAGARIKLLGSLDNLDTAGRHPALQGPTLKH